MQINQLQINKKYHQFNPAVIYAYFNLNKYLFKLEKNYLQVNRQKETNVFIFNSIIPKIASNKKIRYYSDILPEDKQNYIITKHMDYLYDLDKLFIKTSPEIRRGIRLIERKEVKILDVDQNIIESLFYEWEIYKKSDKKIYQLLFDAKRYKRCFELKEKGFNIYQKSIFINDIPYGIICFSIENNIAFELAFISLYWKKELKIINDLNECILVLFFYNLWKNGIKIVNPGTDAGIKGLKIFKQKILSDKLIYYSFLKKDNKENELF